MMHGPSDPNRNRFDLFASLRPKPSLRLSFAAFSILVCALMTVACIVDLQHARSVAVGVARREAENLAQSLAQQGSDTFEAVDGVLLALVQRAEQDGIDPAGRERLRESMAALVTTMPRLHGLFIVDRRGGLVVSNTSAAARPDLNFADRPYFRYHQNHPGATVHISGPARSKSDNALVLLVTRRIDGVDGSFAGVAIASIGLDYFEGNFAGVDVGRSGTIALVADDGALLVRRPQARVGAKFDDLAMFADPYKFFTAASYIAASPVDGVRRLVAFRRLDRYPVSVNVALPESEYLAPWRSDALANYIALALATALLGVLAGGLGLQMEQRRKAENTLARLPPFDGLTGLANRPRFDAELKREWRRAARDRTPLGLLMIDIGNLHNERRSREAADEWLISVARTISANIVRPSNIAARYAEATFAVILPAINETCASIVAERIRAAILALAKERQADPLGTITGVIIGAASLMPVSWDEPARLVEAADSALDDARCSTATLDR